MTDQKKVILFGCGEIGFRLLQYFGNENVFAFCDNSCTKRDTKYGIYLIPYKELKNVIDDHILILSVNPQNQGEIIDQLVEDDIRDFVVYDRVLYSEMKRSTPEEFLAILSDDRERLFRERDYLFRRLNYKEDQLHFLQEISDIHSLKPAKGYVNSVKNKLKEFVNEVFDELSILEIKPFVAAGTAIGLYRHNGFIPWDDDVDFGLFRKDYKKLIDYGMKHFPFIEVSLGDEGDKLQAEYFRRFPDEYFMIVSPNCLQIKKGTSWIDSNTVDFFPYDFYEDDYPYERHLDNIRECATWRRLETGTKRILDLIDNYGHTCSDSNTISFGLDGMDPYVCPKKGWMKRDVMFPLRKTAFEGIPCYAPNNIREYLSYCYKDFEGYPSDIGALHGSDRDEIMKSFYVSMMIVVEDEDFTGFIGLYNKLRGKGIYCLFLLNRSFLVDKSHYDSIKEKLIASEVQYTNEIDPDFDCYIAGNNVRIEVDKDIIIYDSAEDPVTVYNQFVEDILHEKYDSGKTKLSLLSVENLVSSV